MATNYATPGVYVEEISKFPPSVVQVATAIPAFIGYTQKAEKGGKDQTKKAVKIRSLLDYETYFGTAPTPDTLTITLDEDNQVKKVEVASKYFLYDSIRLFYDNGGGECYIVSVGDYTKDVKNTLLTGGIKVVEKLDEPTLLVAPEMAKLSDSDVKSVYTEMLGQCKKLQNRFAIFDLPDSLKSDIPSSLDTIRDGFGNNDLKYAAAYFPGLQTNYRYQIGYDDIVKTGAVKKVGETDFDVTDLFIDKLYDVIKDAAASDEDKQAAIETLTEIDPIYKAIIAACEKETRILPPGGAIAGVYASVDRDRGVWKAPANVSLNSVIGPSILLTDEDNGDLNVDSKTGKSINAIRAFTGKGTLVWGARTLAGNDNEWRYISVRRFFNMVEESVKRATEQFVFEPNDANTWVKVRAMIENFLILQWRAGALAGAKPEHAFYVRVGLGQTMTADDILNGRMNIEIGMAAVRPAEFIVLKFSHKMQES